MKDRNYEVTTTANVPIKSWTPFRDHSHAMWDRKQIGNLPVYAVANGRTMLLRRRGLIR